MMLYLGYIEIKIIYKILKLKIISYKIRVIFDIFNNYLIYFLKNINLLFYLLSIIYFYF